MVDHDWPRSAVQLLVLLRTPLWCRESNPSNSHSTSNTTTHYSLLCYHVRLMCSPSMRNRSSQNGSGDCFHPTCHLHHWGQDLQWPQIAAHHQCIWCFSDEYTSWSVIETGSLQSSFLFSPFSAVGVWSVFTFNFTFNSMSFETPRDYPIHGEEVLPEEVRPKSRRNPRRSNVKMAGRPPVLLALSLAAFPASCKRP